MTLTVIACTRADHRFQIAMLSIPNEVQRLMKPSPIEPKTAISSKTWT